MKTNSTIHITYRAPNIGPYKVPVLSAVAILFLVLIGARLLTSIRFGGKLGEGLKLICGPNVKFKIKRKRIRSKLFAQIDEVFIRPSPGEPLDHERVVEHLERVYHGYNFKKIQNRQGGYDVFQASRKI